MMYKSVCMCSCHIACTNMESCAQNQEKGFKGREL